MEKVIERSSHNGDLRLENVGETVKLVGWVAKKRDLGTLTFIDLRDRYGIVQLLLDNSKYTFPDVRNEYLIHCEGVVHKKDVPNKALKTGAIEILVSNVEVINKAETTPLIIDDNTDALEDVRLKYRYLDLRRPILQKNLALRAKVIHCVHEYLDANDFLEIETPCLTLSTPEGAREYIVPSRISPKQVYVLPQSPQIYKQLLMISGFERYYQVARCFRDEDLRADRQPEFTQIDIETSFLNQEQLLNITEGLLHKIFKETINYEVKLPLRKMEWEEATNVYGSDKPDTRFDLKLHDLKSILSQSEFNAFSSAKYIKGFVVKGKAEVFSRKYSDGLNLLANKFNLKNYFIIKYENNVFTGSLAKFITPSISSELIKEYNLENNDVIVVAAGDIKYDINFGLGALRSQLGHEFKLIDENNYDIFWVVHWPLFAKDERTGVIAPEHHPFTRPCDEDLDKLMTHPEQVYAYCYDIIINGYEAGGGSLRIYDGNVQKEIFTLLGFSDEDIKRKFGFFIDAFKYGTPPHGGLALGLERLVMVLAKTDNIRDVIAFPKNLKARDMMSNAPSDIAEKDIEQFGLQFKGDKKDE
jgi:aspartyl-tRNA synthetase